MAKKSAIKKNETRIRKVSLMGKKRKALKDIIMNRDLPLEERFTAQMKLNEMPRDGSSIRVRNRCLVTEDQEETIENLKCQELHLEN